MQPVERITELLAACGSPAGILPPTSLFNEGWMLRLVLDAYARLPGVGGPLKPAPGARWRSEVLLPSRFRPRTRGDPLAEGWTHADGVVGHFSLCPGARGDICLEPGATQFVVVEAKMFSPFSAGTSRAPGFNQVARNVCCMVEAVSRAGIEPSDAPHMAFVVLAPAGQLALPEFADVLDRDSLHDVIAARVASFGGSYDKWYQGIFTACFNRIAVVPIAWERAVTEIAAVDPAYGSNLASFLERCFRFNKPGAIE